MTNELLAILAQNGHKASKLALWDNMQGLYYKKAAVYYLANIDKCISHGVELDDLRQVCYFAFLDAVKSYDPDKGFLFSTFINYPFQNAVNALLGLRTERGRQEPLNHAASLDKPIETADGDSSTLLDFIADEESIDFLDDVDRDSEAAFIRQAVEDLPEPLRMVIRRYYLENRQLHEIGEEMGVSIERVRQYKVKGLRELRKNKRLQCMYKEQKAHEYMLQVMRWEHSPERFAMIRQLNTKKLSYGYKQAELCAARERWIKIQKPEEEETNGYSRRRAALLSIFPPRN